MLSCLARDDDANALATVNLTTDPFPATTGLGGGDAEFRGILDDIPSPCYAPIVLVLLGNNDRWTAVSGF